MIFEVTNCILTLEAFLQSVPTRIGVWWRGGWRQGDSGWRLRWVIHRQDQTGAPDCHFVVPQAELVIQTFIRRAAPSAVGGGTFAVDDVRSRRIRVDGDVGVHGAHVGVVQDEVRVIVMERTLILVGREGKGGGGGSKGMKS